MWQRTLIFTLLISCLSVRAAERSYVAVKANGPIHIDGKLDELAWKSATIAGDFTQNEPVQDGPVSQRTEVRLVYDNTSLYIAAMLYDSAPDSILHQLGERDDSYGINADDFRIGLDPYNNRLDGYVFIITASGVQCDLYRDDRSFDAVWESAVKITSEGWVAEIRIPYSALRFPDKPEQTWGLQFARLIRRSREYDQWSPVRKDLRNPLVGWGTMTGMRNITPPLRLSVTPYLSIYAQHAPAYVGGSVDHYENSYSYSGGADLKVGLDESFTLDMTLLPDFSQVQSDDKIKNLTAFEQIFKERRPFFNEGTALFNTGKLFYSRRIGKTPTLFYAVIDSLQSGEELIKNPTAAHLVNSVKVSGRTNGGLGIGVMNSITGNTFAEIRKKDGSIRSLLTEPLTNYSIVVLDQQLKNNSDVWFINTNTMREGRYRDANVYSAGTSLENKIHSIRFTGRYANSRVWETPDTADSKALKNGNQVAFSLEKISGRIQFGTTQEFGDKNFDKNDLGYIFINNYSMSNFYGSYNLYNPFLKIFRQGSADCYIGREGRWSEHNQLTALNAGANVFLLFNNMWSFFMNANTNLSSGKDWYEPRVNGRYYVTPKNTFLNFDFSTNYNKPLAFNYGFNFDRTSAIGQRGFGYYLQPMVRFNDHFSMNIMSSIQKTTDARGFCTFDTVGNPVFGRRDVSTLTTTLGSRYQFTPNLSLTLSVRHYWSKGVYDRYFSLNEDGTLSDYPNLPDGNLPFSTNFNSNYFNVDFIFNWIFAPGSSLLLTYKDQIASDNDMVTAQYTDNLTSTLKQPQTNSLALKVLYFIDYERVTSGRKKR